MLIIYDDRSNTNVDIALEDGTNPLKPRGKISLPL